MCVYIEPEGAMCVRVMFNDPFLMRPSAGGLTLLNYPESLPVQLVYFTN